MKRRSGAAVAEAGWSKGLVLRAQGTGTVTHAGVVLPRLLADRVGLTAAFRDVLARRGYFPGRDRGRAVTDTVAALATGAQCLSDVEAMTAQCELFDPTGGASDTTVLRVLGEYADRLREDGLPAVRVAGKDLTRDSPAGVKEEQAQMVVIRLDATVIAVASSERRRRGELQGFRLPPPHRVVLQHG